MGPLATPAGDGAEEGLVTAGLQAELVQHVSSGVGEIVSPRRTLWSASVPSVRGQRVPPVPTVPRSGPEVIVQHGDPAPSWDVPAEDREEQIYRQITGPGRGCCCQRLSFFNVSPTHCLLTSAFSQGKSVFSQPSWAPGAVNRFLLPYQ